MADYRDLQVSIIGAGMGGLTAALAFAKKGFKQVHVYEQAPALGFVSGGNSSLEKEATNVKEVYIYDGPSNNELARVPMEDIHQKYGYSHYAGHRASLAGNIFDAAKAQPNVHFHFGQTLQSVTSFGPDKVTFVIKSGDDVERVVETDVEETGTAAYRILVEREKMEPYPELLELIDSDAVRRWIGSKRHIIAYPIHNHTIYNVATAQPDVNFAGSINATWTNKGDKKAMKDVYSDFCPLVQKLLDLVPDGDVVEWRLRSHKPLDTWTLGGVALLGDACHPTLPHLSQGAAMAIEDAAVLAEAVSLVPGGGADRQELAKTLKVYELARKPRTSTLVELAALSARTLHLGEGKAKEERDRQFAAAKTKGAPVPDKWASPEIQKMIFEHECVGDIRERFKELYASLSGGVDEAITARI
ncbi:hypothetical protein FSOLCH5_006241 [Fusarium solani]